MKNVILWKCWIPARTIENDTESGNVLRHRIRAKLKLPGKFLGGFQLLGKLRDIAAARFNYEEFIETVPDNEMVFIKPAGDEHPSTAGTQYAGDCLDLAIAVPKFEHMRF